MLPVNLTISVLSKAVWRDDGGTKGGQKRVALQNSYQVAEHGLGLKLHVRVDNCHWIRALTQTAKNQVVAPRVTQILAGSMNLGHRRKVWTDERAVIATLDKVQVEAHPRLALQISQEFSDQASTLVVYYDNLNILQVCILLCGLVLAAAGTDESSTHLTLVELASRTLEWALAQCGGSTQWAHLAAQDQTGGEDSLFSQPPHSYEPLSARLVTGPRL